jgi:peptidoglycan hydrolase CwlO-like protein
MAYMYLVLVVTVILLGMVIVLFFNAYKKNKEVEYLKDIILEKDTQLSYYEIATDKYDEKIVKLNKELKKTREENAALVEKITKINSQFKNVKEYLNKN